MNRLRLRFFRVLVISAAVVASMQVGSKIGKANPSCMLTYLYTINNCGIPENCAYGDGECIQRNAGINQCYDNAWNAYVACEGYAN